MFTVKKLADDVFGFGEFYQNEKVISYLIIGDDMGIVFDTGIGIYNIQQEIRKIYSGNLIIINSHHHFDHIGGNHLFTNIVGFDHTLMQKAENGYSNTSIKSYFIPTNFIYSPKNFDASLFSIQPFIINKKIQEYDILNIGKYTFHVIHTPGHSDDSICLYEHHKKRLFAGDTLYNGPIYIENPKEYINSLSKIMSLDIISVFPGHNTFIEPGTIIQDIYKQKDNIITLDTPLQSCVIRNSLIIVKK